jgi:hypothetical protein
MGYRKTTSQQQKKEKKITMILSLFNNRCLMESSELEKIKPAVGQSARWCLTTDYLA